MSNMQQSSTTNPRLGSRISSMAMMSSNPEVGALYVKPFVAATEVFNQQANVGKL